MSTMKQALAVAVAAVLTVPPALACTSVMVGKAASANGSIIISRTEDFSSNDWAKHLTVFPAKTYEKGESIILSNGLEVPAPRKTFRYTAMVDWDAFSYKTPNKGKAYEQRGTNEMNVAMSATNSAEINEKALKADPQTNGITEQVMLGLVLGQATSARHGVEVLASYIEEYGAGEGYGVQFADNEEAWYMEVGAGHQWIAVRVPDDKYLVVANGLRIHGVNLDSDDVMHAEGLFEMVRGNQLLDNPDRKNFNFARAFGVTGDIYNIDREWISQKMLSPSFAQKPRMDQYPLFLSPDAEISIENIAAVLRSSSYEGTELEKDGVRPIGVERNLQAHIIEMNPSMPDELSAVIWQTPSNILYSPFIPLYNVINDIPEAYIRGTNRYDNQSAWWNFRVAGSLATNNVLDGQYHSLVVETWQAVEQQFINSQPYMNSMLKSMYANDADLAITFASNYSNGVLQTTLEKASHLKSAILTGLTRSTEKKFTPEEFEKISNL